MRRYVVKSAVWMKLVTGTYSSLSHDVSSLALLLAAKRLSAMFLPLTFTLPDAMAAESAGAVLVATLALSGRPEYDLGNFAFFLSNSTPASIASFSAFALAFFSSCSFCDSMANFLAFISSGVIGTLRLKPTL